MKITLPTSVFTIALSLFSIINASAQFTTLWEDDYTHTFSSNYSNEGRKVAVDPDNNYVYVLSDVTSDLDPSGMVTGPTFSYTVLNQYDLVGNLINSEAINVGSHTISGFDFKSAFSLELDATGNVYIGYMSFDAVTDFDVNIAKYNSALTLQWTYKYNPSTDDQGLDMKVSSSGTAYAVVKCTSSIASIRTRIVKATASGISATALFSFNSNPDFLNSIAIDASQNIYVTGYRLVNGVKNILTASLTSTGTLRWIRTDNCGTITGDDFARYITVGFDGQIYLTGSSQGTTQHGIDVITMKLNQSNGKKVWDNLINQNLNDGGFFVSAPAQDLVFVCWTAGNSVYVDQLFSTTSLLGRRGVYSPLPVSPYTSLNGVTITDLKVSSRNNLYITGNISATASGDPFTANYLVKVNFANRGSSPIERQITVEGSFSNTYKSAALAIHEPNGLVFMLRDEYHDNSNHAQEIVGLECYQSGGAFRVEDNNADFNSNRPYVNIAPNPTISKTYLKCSESISKIEISDISGRLINSYVYSDGNSTTVELDLSEFPSGFYTVRTYGSTGFLQVDKVLKD